MTKRIEAASPRPRARMTGVVYLLYFLTAISAETFIGRSRLVAYDAVNLISQLFYVAVTLLFYGMFKPVNARFSLLAALFSLAGCAIDVLGVFNIAVYGVSPLIFFGPYCLLLGYLIFRSTFLPRILGVLMMLAGLGWLIFLSPHAGTLSTYLEVLGFLAELSLCLWLIMMGVNVPKWREKINARRVGDG
ncbi:DUF4386 domain-containing protein [Dyella dinghuensis]|nr:DUF4386 domain-containing protein [Dyella dinghuensis]